MAKERLWRNKSQVVQGVYLDKSGEMTTVHPARAVWSEANPNPKFFEPEEDYRKRRGKSSPVMMAGYRPSSSKDLVSVITPTYNCMDYLPEMIASVWAQDYKNLEVVIVDDGSTDKTVEYLISVDKKITKFLTYKDRRGSNYARNQGFRISRGEFVLFCDADSVLRPNLVSAMKVQLEINSGAAYAYCKYNSIDEETGKLVVVGGGDWDANRLRQANYIDTMSLLRREEFVAFDEKVKRYQDYDLWLTLLDKGKTGTFVNQVLFDSLKRKNSITNTESEKEALTYIRKKHGIER